MNRIKQINTVYFATIMLFMLSGQIPFTLLIKDKAMILIITQLIIALPSILYLVIHRIKYQEAVRLKRIRPKTIFFLILFAYLIIPVMNLINALSQLFAVNTTAQVMLDLTKNTPFLFGVFVIGVVPAVLEESVYRGIFYNEYSKYNRRRAILLSAFLFGILHGNMNQFTYAFAMGIIFALVIEATDSIVSTMIIHFIINGNSVVLMYAYPWLLRYLENTYQAAKQSGNQSVTKMIEGFMGGSNFNLQELLQTSQTVIGQQSLWDVLRSYSFLALICGFFAYIVFRKIMKTEGREQEICILLRERTKQKRLGTVPLYIGIIVCLVSMILYEFIVRGMI